MYCTKWTDWLTDGKASFSLLENVLAAARPDEPLPPGKACQLPHLFSKSLHYELVKRKSEEGGAWSVTFEKFHHCISRLNHSLDAVEVLVEAGTRLDFLFEQTIEVARVESQRPAAYSLVDGDLQFNEVVQKFMFNTCDDKLRAEYEAALLLLDEHLVERLQNRLHLLSHPPKTPRQDAAVKSENEDESGKEDKPILWTIRAPKKTARQDLEGESENDNGSGKEDKSISWITRVHAELLILNRFWTNKYKF